MTRVDAVACSIQTSSTHLKTPPGASHDRSRARLPGGSESDVENNRETPVDRFVRRSYRVCAVAVLGLALFNLTFRLGSEFVTEWDESLYAISAWEAAHKGFWIGTTFLGALDYYNTKPPLLVWMIALSFKAFGAGLVSLRLTSVLSAWLTVAVLQVWARRRFGPLVALLSSLVLATTFGFIHIHSGRSAATDAPFTLVVLLTVVTLWAEGERPGRRVWLGPLFAAAFLLRGMAVLMPAALLIAFRLLRRHVQAPSWKATLTAVALFLLPVSAWIAARYRVDGWTFLGPLFMYDFVTRTLSPIEGHPGGPFFFLDVLQKNHYDWLFAAALGLILFRVNWREARARLARLHTHGDVALLAVWGGVVLAIPTLMQTKLPWYLNTFYPVFAVYIGSSLAYSCRVAWSAPQSRRRMLVFAAGLVVALGVAESRLIWYSLHYRDLTLSGQSLVLAERERLRGHRLYLQPFSRAGYFVAEAVVGARPLSDADDSSFLRDGREGDYLLTSDECLAPELEVVRSNGRDFLYRRRETNHGSEK